MKKLKLRIEDPDNFFRKCIREDTIDADPNDECADFYLTVREGELPPRFPKFICEVIE